MSQRQLSDDELFAKIPDDVMAYCERLTKAHIRFRIKVDDLPAMGNHPAQTFATVIHERRPLPGPLPRGASFRMEYLDR